jgi:nucleoside-diphosphate-sugar epimerase
MAVIGGSGFIGSHLLDAIRRDGRTARVLTRHPRPRRDGAVEVTGSLEDSASLARLVTPGATVVNLAWSGRPAPADAEQQAHRLAAACRAAGARRLKHSSSVAVMGGHQALSRVDEATPPRPADGNGRAKLAAEQTIVRDLDGRVPLVVLRPASVLGPGGQSLVRMSAALLDDSPRVNYLKSCLFWKRLLHLVPVESVVHAVLHLDALDRQDTSCYFVSADDDPHNRYRDVELLLMRAFGRPDYGWPRIPAPALATRLALRAAGRSQGLPFTVVDDRKLRATGFIHPITVAQAVTAFAATFAAGGRDAAAPAP